MALSELDYICACADSFDATLVKRSSNTAIFSVAPALPSRRPTVAFEVEVTIESDRVTAKEAQPGTQLPKFCPERHINLDGTFCLYWEKAEYLDLLSVKGATAWWAKLCLFLTRQQTAAILKRWPGQSLAWAHGPAAATLQAEAERIASEFGNGFSEALREGQLVVQRVRKKNEYRLRLIKCGRRVATITERSRRVMTRRQICKCEAAQRSRRPLCACSNHEGELIQLIIARHDQKKAEQDFFDQIANSGYVCCGTIDDCPLASLSKTTRDNAA